MVSPYKIAGTAAIGSLLLGIIVAILALSMEGSYDSNPQYLIYLGVLLLSIGLTILYYRGFIILAKRLSDRLLLTITLAVFVLTLLANIAQFVYSSVLFLETSYFNIYDALMHQNSTYGLLIFNVYVAFVSILFGYGLLKSKIPSKLASWAGMISIFSGVVVLLVSEMLGGLMYIIAGIMLIILLFKIDEALENKKEEHKEDRTIIKEEKQAKNKTVRKKRTLKKKKAN
jgi:membrane-associated HD superfamily phosphohydrolase